MSFHHIPHNSTRLHPAPSWNNTKLRQEVNTWKVNFQGLGGELTVQRFLKRVEWHANRSAILLDQVVQVLDLCLEGEALEWFWCSVDRYPEITWEEMKQAMIIRFTSSTTPDDVRRTLNSRQQKYPRESIQEFYQAIQKIALQSEKPISDDTLYTIIRRNMRPGLQMELHEEHDFASLASFIRRCGSLEALWRRFGHNPEAGLRLVNQPRSPPYEAERFRPRPQVRFSPHTSRVSELESEHMSDMMGDEEHYVDDREQTDGYYRQVCAINHQLKLRHRPNAESHLRDLSPAPQSNRNFSCWNCGESSHSFTDCGKRVTGTFCFGCGTRNVLKPNCTRCSQTENWRSEMRHPRKPHLGPGESSRQPHGTTEEAASNTDPELYARHPRY